jgi:hypothetical protein
MYIYSYLFTIGTAVNLLSAQYAICLKCLTTVIFQFILPHMQKIVECLSFAVHDRSLDGLTVYNFAVHDRSLDELTVYNFTQPGPRTIWPDPTKAQISPPELWPSPERSPTSFILAQIKPTVRLFTIFSHHPIIIHNFLWPSYHYSQFSLTILSLFTIFSHHPIIIHNFLSPSYHYSQFSLTVISLFTIFSDHPIIIHNFLSPSYHYSQFSLTILSLLYINCNGWI